MYERIKHYPVNWIDGMKVSKKHFLEEESAILDLLRDGLHSRLTSYNFGLLLPETQQSDSYNIEINPDIIEVPFCRAVTRAGIRIEVTQQGIDGLRIPTHQLVGGDKLPGSSEWYILLRATPFEREPFGNPNPAESPLRHPFTRSKYSLEIASTSQVRSIEYAGHTIPLAKIQGNSGGLKQIVNYIPPCATTGSCKSLEAVYQQYSLAIKDIENYAFDIINKIKFKRKSKENNPLSDDIFLLCTSIVQYIAASFDTFRLRYQEEPPLVMVEYFVRIARVARTAMKLMQEKDSMLEYFRHYVEKFQPAAWEGAVEDLCTSSYDHLDIRKSLDKVDYFLALLKDLLATLVGLDYQRLARHDIVQSQTFMGSEPRHTSKPGNNPPNKDIIIKSGKKDKGGWGLK